MWQILSFIADRLFWNLVQYMMVQLDQGTDIRHGEETQHDGTRAWELEMVMDAWEPQAFHDWQERQLQKERALGADCYVHWSKWLPVVQDKVTDKKIHPS